jgi:hypothetical protein
MDDEQLDLANTVMLAILEGCDMDNAILIEYISRKGS